MLSRLYKIGSISWITIFETSNQLIIEKTMKQKSLFFFTLILSLDFILLNPDRNIGKSEFVDKICNMDKINNSRDDL